MCGRYELEASKRALWERYHLLETEEEGAFSPKEEVFPTNTCPVILPGPQLAELKWGFEESFSKKPLINARAETILQKPTFRDAFLHSRCLVPVTAFFEWEEKAGGKKIKRRISAAGLPIFSLAGIRKSYPQADGSSLETFSIITVDASPELWHIHNRMPVMIAPEDEGLYLDAEQPASEIKKLLVPSTLQLNIQ